MSEPTASDQTTSSEIADERGTSAAPVRDEVCFASPQAGETIEDVLVEPPPRRRRWLLPLVLFLATCATTFSVGVNQWPIDRFPFEEQAAAWLERYWRDGLWYMLAVLGILFVHEMGHFLMTIRYGIHASYPIFVPFPVFIGTMGAVIAMDGRQADRKQLFDIGIAGPLAGLVVAIPVLCLGVLQATLDVPGPNMRVTGDPLLAELLIRWLRPDAPVGAEVLQSGNPLYMAGWVGMLLTGLNMMPLSQLDGGHVIYSLFGRRAHYLARTFLLTAIAYMIIADNYRWALMVVIVTILGVDHPPSADDGVQLGRGRYLLGLASLAIPVLCFIPNPI
jgi:membrane-associated protease RseP (regulator of RpoE activity)